MSAESTKAVRVYPPKANKCQKISASTVAAATALIAGLRPSADSKSGCWVTVKNVGAATVWILFGDSTVTVDATAVPGATLGWPLRSGECENFELSASDTHIATDGEGASDIVLYRSSY